MDKIRINDLARDLEVKSKAILDVLPEVGVTEKKTHSSSITVEEAERVKARLKGHSDGNGGQPRAHTSRSNGEDELKPKFDLSHISRPGDVLKAIHQKTEAPAVPARPAVKPPEPPRPAVVTTPAVPTVQKPVMPPAPPKPQVEAAAPASAPAVEEPVASKPAPEPESTETIPAQQAPAPRLITPQPRQAPRIVVPSPPPAAKAPEPTAPVEPAKPAAEPAAPAAAAKPPAATPSAPAQRPPQGGPGQPVRPVPGQPIRRLIVPQTGPRPVYSAPVRPVNPAASSTPGARPQGGRPVPGQPIFQRPRPQGGQGAPMGNRPPLRPGERRPMHPTRSAPTGARPMGGGIGAVPPPPTGRPAGRPAPSRRPGQRYIPRGVKEGPMKGFVPPPRMVISNEPLPITRTITIAEGISVKDLAEKLGIRAKDLIARLLARGVFATINQTLDAELASDMSRQFGADTSVITFEQQAEKDMASEGTPEEAAQALIPRSPVVTIMGHVDHGKTSLLDAIRHASVAEGEAGGITQHIGAYKVTINDPDSPAYGRQIVFLDTPGHEAFTRMRSRGAKVTDIVVLVVAADDGVMPQTLEAIDHARAAEVPIIVAVNKIDKPEAMPDRVKKQLADRGLMPEDWGGTTVFVDVSAKKKTNLNLLLEMICLVADLQELRANPARSASGVVLEAKLDRGRGPVATVLVQDGTLRTGDNFVVGNVYGKVRAMFDDRGAQLEEAPPSTPVEILGMEGLPQAGDQFVVVADRDKARGISEYREQKA